MGETLRAGRELDAIVAEKLFGYVWRRSRTTGRRCLYAPGHVPEHMQEVADGTEPLVGDWDRHRWTPEYSSDISAAWQVVGELQTRGLCLRLEQSLMGHLWWAVFANPSESLPPRSGAEELGAPLAICRAALKAMEAVRPLTLLRAPNQEQP